MKLADGLFVPSPRPFPRAPVGFEEGHNGAALALSPMTKAHFLGFFFLERVAAFEMEGNMEKQISTIETGKFRDLRVSISDWKGHDMVGLRQWVTPYKENEGDRIPTKNGVSFHVRDLPEVIAALRKAEQEARAAGLFSEEAA